MRIQSARLRFSMHVEPQKTRRRIHRLVACLVSNHDSVNQRRTSFRSVAGVLLIVFLWPMADLSLAQRITMRETTDGVRIVTLESRRSRRQVHVVVYGHPGRHDIAARTSMQLFSWPLQKGKLTCVSGDDFERVKSVAQSLRPDLTIQFREEWKKPDGQPPPSSAFVSYPQANFNRASIAAIQQVNELIDRRVDHFVARTSDRTNSILVSARVFRKPLQGDEQRHLRLLEYWRPAERVRQMRWIAHRLLVELQMISSESNPDIFSAIPRTVLKTSQVTPITVAIYDGPGTGAPMPFARDLEQGASGVYAVPINSEEIRQGALRSFDVVFFAGGMASKQYESLAGDGQRQVKKFVEDGGGYVGICAGAFLASGRPYRWGLDLLDARIVDHDHWNRGIGKVKLQLSRTGNQLFGEDTQTQFNYHYGNGPIWAPLQRADLTDYRTLGWYRTGVGKNGADSNVMIDTPAMIAAPLGKGRVFAASGHAEWSDGLEHFVPKYVEWAAGRVNLTE